jgi:D-psicose/D-tagatose/L-ribulose 3-epimerase
VTIALLMVTRRTFLAGSAAAFVCPEAWGRARKVKVGVCTRDVAGAAKYGFDYVEPAAAEIAAMSKDLFREFSDTMLVSPLRCHAFNSFIRRPDLKVVGPEVPTSALKEYLEGCLPRCRRLGASIVVWGSAGSRNVPEGFSREQARDQIAAFLKMTGEVARQSHVIVAIEPLTRIIHEEWSRV